MPFWCHPLFDDTRRPGKWIAAELRRDRPELFGLGDALGEYKISSAFKSPGDEGADEASEVFDIDRPGMPGRRPMVERYDGGFRDRPKLAIASTEVRNGLPTQFPNVPVR
ncbi:hypothetical protein PG985_010603 [Apiospora marii]|uniref:Uncharacterized protein n=1 Tax=Apiospora marii TaxID=335849 RepID=A0ABR1T1E7_9PEZI